MARIKYYYDTESCKYERIKVSTGDIFINVLGLFFLGVIISIGLLFMYFKYFDSPKEALLKKENQELLFKYQILNSKLGKVDDMLAVLQNKDDNIYRVIFEAEPISPSIREAGSGGVEKYQDIIDEELIQEELVLSTFERIDHLKKKMYIQTKSHDEILALARNKEQLLDATPAIQPISNKKLTRLSSGYGIRMHPVFKKRMMHWGVDYSAPSGTPVYATANGVIKIAKRSSGGFGNRVVIDHGFGYKTLYGHLQNFNVRRGQKVKRGEKIGAVGSSGRSTAPHLHYEVHFRNKRINAVHFFFRDLTSEEYAKVVEISSVENQSFD
jgi:murein DD-endopeptidase MepM/ murein hydrolase activator NlpD